MSVFKIEIAHQTINNTPIDYLSRFQTEFVRFTQRDNFVLRISVRLALADALERSRPEEVFDGASRGHPTRLDATSGSPSPPHHSS